MKILNWFKRLWARRPISRRNVLALIEHGHVVYLRDNPQPLTVAELDGEHVKLTEPTRYSPIVHTDVSHKLPYRLFVQQLVRHNLRRVVSW